MTTHDKKMREITMKPWALDVARWLSENVENFDPEGEAKLLLTLDKHFASEVKLGVEEAEKQIIQATIDLLDIKPTLNSKDTIVLLKSIIIPSTQEHE